MEIYKTQGAISSEFDVRTFTYTPIKANIKGGERWGVEDIEDQMHEGICTAISLTMKAKKFHKIDFSEEFQYLMQKQQDGNWDEGSSILSAIKVGYSIGFLPQSEWSYTTLEDRKLPYSEYIAKLRQIPKEEVQKLKEKAKKYKLKAYAQLQLNPEYIKNAIDSDITSSVLCRFALDEAWWTPPIEPLRPPVKIISGHAINMTNYNGDSYRLANSWGADWGDKGTAYSLFSKYMPTEAWQVWFADVPKEVQKQIDSRDTIKGQILDLLQQIIKLVIKL